MNNGVIRSEDINFSTCLAIMETMVESALVHML